MQAKNGTKERIKEQALLLLAECSIQKFGVNQLIAQCGITKGALYHHFPEGKNQIIKEAILSAHADRFSEAHSYYESGKSLGQSLSDICASLASILEKTQFSSCSPIVRVAIDCAAEDKEIQKICQDILKTRHHFHYEKLLLFGFSEEESQKKSQFIVCSIEGGLLLSRALQSVSPLVQTGDVLKKLFSNFYFKLEKKGI